MAVDLIYKINFYLNAKKIKNTSLILIQDSIFDILELQPIILTEKLFKQTSRYGYICLNEICTYSKMSRAKIDSDLTVGFDALENKFMGLQ